VATRAFITVDTMETQLGKSLLSLLDLTSSEDLRNHVGLPGAIGYANGKMTAAVRKHADPETVESDEYVQGICVTLARAYLLENFVSEKMSDADRLAKKDAIAEIDKIADGKVILQYPTPERATTYLAARTVVIGSNVPDTDRPNVASASAAFKAY
jgi:hypothetical protein